MNSISIHFKNELNNKLIHGNLSFEYEDGNLYAIVKDGADTVSKKLGSEIKEETTESTYLQLGGHLDVTIPDKTIAVYAIATDTPSGTNATLS